MKKLSLALLALLIMVLAAGCKGTANEESAASSAAVSSAAQDTAVAAAPVADTVAAPAVDTGKVAADTTKKN